MKDFFFFNLMFEPHFIRDIRSGSAINQIDEAVGNFASAAIHARCCVCYSRARCLWWRAC